MTTDFPGSRFPAPPARPLTLSVVMAIYNEASTVAASIDEVLGVELADVTIELIIVESNSTDGTRDIVLGYADDPRVVIALQDEAKGKGNAVREGLRLATGGIILIQDADLEYSVTDYGPLIAPILAGDADFTLGCRHVPGKPIRVMEGTRAIASVVNAGHWVFLWMFNTTYRTHLRDPFTMYKVFRSECIEGVEFVADRFDFDWELVAKLIRLGYAPVELPVEYTARSFEGGKKVRFFRDPPTWVWACLRFRVCRLPRQPRPSAVEALGDDGHLSHADPDGSVAQSRRNDPVRD